MKFQIKDIEIQSSEIWMDNSIKVIHKPTGVERTNNQSPSRTKNAYAAIEEVKIIVESL